MRKTILLTGLAALTMSAPAVADRPDTAGKPAEKPAKAKGKSQSQSKGATKRCKVHSRAFVVAGTYQAGDVVVAADGTATGTTVTVAVDRTNKHARADKGKTVVYSLAGAKIKVKDANADGKVDQADVAAGNRVKLTGKTTFRHKKCTGEFTPATTFRRVTIAAPKTEKQQAPAPAAAPAPAPAPAPAQG